LEFQYGNNLDKIGRANVVLSHLGVATPGGFIFIFHQLLDALTLRDELLSD
jgi:hypothetical protein